MGFERSPHAGDGVGGPEVVGSVDGGGAEDARKQEVSHHGVGGARLTGWGGGFGWLAFFSQFRCGHSREVTDTRIEFEEQVAQFVVGAGGFEQADDFQDEGQNAAFRAEGGEFGFFEIAEGRAEAGAGFGEAESQSERATGAAAASSRSK